MKFVFLMDPLRTVIMEKDTSFILMLGAVRRGHEVYFLPDGGMTLKDGHLILHTTQVIPQSNKEKPFIEEDQVVLKDTDVDAIFIRRDPPFDESYLMNTWLLERTASKVTIINHPQGVRSANEKIWATQFSSIIPPTLVGRNRQELLEFCAQHSQVIAKPTHGFGGKSIFRIDVNDLNTKVILETLTEHFTRDIILQKFIPESEKGDKRILLLDGEPLGAVLRVAAGDDHRNNFFSGGKPYPVEINARDREIIATIKPQLKALGLYFVGIDIIGDYLIEVNVTSPTCLQEMNRFMEKQLEDQVITFVEKLVEENSFKDKITL